MIGRGAMGRPEIFAQARGWRSEPLTRDEMIGLLQRYVAQQLVDGATEHHTLGRLKQRGAEVVGEVVRYQDVYRLCYIRGPEGILIGLAEELSR